MGRVSLATVRKQKQEGTLPISRPAPTKPFRGTIYGFADAEAFISVILDKHISDAERQDYFYYNWKRGGHWKYGVFFGGCWYASFGEEIPPIKLADKVSKISWPQFVAEGKRHSQKLNMPHTAKYKPFWENL